MNAFPSPVSNKSMPLTHHGRIRPLPEHVASKITSSATITSLNSVVLGLLANALDAASSKVEIQIDPSRGSCTVSDDGSGVHPAEFQAAGGLGKSYYTSKVDQIGAVHGKHGTFLASLSAVSFLSITSKHHGHRSTNRITFHTSQVVSRLTPVSEAHGIRFHEHGTTVTVRDLFGNMPVRVKQRALEQEPVELERHAEELKLSITAFLSAWPDPVSLKCSINGIGKNEVILHLTKPSETHHGQDIPSTSPSSSTTRLSSLLVQSGCLSSASWQSWIPASASSKTVSIDGTIGLKPWPTKQLQFISIGIQPLLQHSGYNELYDAVNKIFKRSDFGSQYDDQLTTDSPVTSPVSTQAIRTPRQKDLKLSRKSVEKWPMFSLRVSFKENSKVNSDAVLQNTSHLEKILEVMHALVSGWLSAHHFRVQLKTPSNSTGKSRTLMPTMDSNGTDSHSFANDSPSPSQRAGTIASHRMRGVEETIPGSPMKPSPKSSIRNENQELPQRSGSLDVNSTLPGQFNRWSMSNQRNVSAEDPPELNTGSDDENSAQVDDKVVLWRDPVSNQLHKVNARTGFAFPRFSASSSTSASRRRLTMTSRQKRSSRPATGWLNDVLQNWQNPVFQNTEQDIPRLAHEAAVSSHKAFQGFALLSGGKLSKESLRNARVISQVDHQFILVALSSSPKEKQTNDILVTIDQHAADERCILETLFAELCQPVDQPPNLSSDCGLIHVGAPALELPKPIIFQVSNQEAQHFRFQVQKFADWGIVYDLDTKPVGIPQTEPQVIVKALPTVIADRCAQEPKVLISMLRSELWQTVEHGRSLTSFSQSKEYTEIDDSKLWIRKIGRCPSGILELLHSRACRSAIMFNDVLSREECIDLVNRLSECAFPFQCAHGRPTMAPLIHLGMEPQTSLSERSPKVSAKENPDSQKSFIDTYRAWKDSGK